MIHKSVKWLNKKNIPLRIANFERKTLKERNREKSGSFEEICKKIKGSSRFFHIPVVYTVIIIHTHKYLELKVKAFQFIYIYLFY